VKTVKKPPMRHCIGCGEELPKSVLIRVVRTPEGDILIDKTGKLSGRGAYLCGRLSCFQKARRSGRLGRSLSSQISAEIYDQLEGQMTKDDE